VKENRTIPENLRELYYGHFSDHQSNGGIFYNLDEVQQLRRKIPARIEFRKEYTYTDMNELYEFYDMIGSGSFSKVYKAKFIPTGEIIAVKVSADLVIFLIRLLYYF